MPRSGGTFVIAVAQQSPHRQLGLKLRESRRNRRLTQVALARAANLDVSTIRLVEAGSGTLASLDRVLAACGLEIRSRQLRGGAVGPALRSLRTRRRFSQRSMAKVLGVARNTLESLERGGSGRVETLARYAAELGAELTLVDIGAPPSSFHVGTGASSVHHGWETPQGLADQLRAALGIFDLDPCAGSYLQSRSTVSARRRLTVAENGLQAPWRGLVFVNPPYGRATRVWVEKCAGAAERPDTTVVALLAVRTDTRWWQDLVAVKAAVCFLRGRVRFGDGTKDAPFASAIAVWNGGPETIAALKGVLAGAWSMPDRQPDHPSSLTD